MKITLIGGHGKVALLAEPLLVQRGHEVRAVIRKAEQAAEIERSGAVPVVEDIEQLDAAGWESLLEGADAVVWSAGAGGGSPERTYRVDRDAAKLSMDAAQKMGAHRYVMVSYLGAGLDHGVDPEDPFYAYAQSKAEADEHLQASSLDWTILGPGNLTLDVPTGQIQTDAEAAAAEPATSRANVARMIAEVVEREDLSGAFIGFADGPTPIETALSQR